METNQDIKHKFKLDGMVVGDWFLSCTHCWFQLGVKIAAKPICQECGNRLSILEVTQKDVDNMKAT